VINRSYSDFLEDLLKTGHLLCSLGSHEAPEVDPVDAGPDGEVYEFDPACDAFVVAVFDDQLKLLLWLQ
jgi:hypothetical protein